MSKFILQLRRAKCMKEDSSSSPGQTADQQMHKQGKLDDWKMKCILERCLLIA